MTTYAAITTCSAEGYADHGRRMEETFRKHWPIPLHRLSNEDLLYRSPWLKFFLDLNGAAFRGRFGNTYDYRHDAMRFAWKTSAIVDYMEDIEADVVFWVDADTVTHSDVPMDFVETLLPEDCYTACLQRPDMYPECGFVAYRKSHEAHDGIMQSWRQLYETRQVFALPEWHDSYVYDQIRMAYEAKGHVKSHNLSGPEPSAHPFVNSSLGAYMDHLKGPRKAGGRTPNEDLVVERTEPYWQP